MKTKQYKNNNPIIDLNGYKLLFIDNYYRYISHTHKIATTGFKKKNILLKYKNDLLATDRAINLCKQRYKKLFEVKPW